MWTSRVALEAVSPAIQHQHHVFVKFPNMIKLWEACWLQNPPSPGLSLASVQLRLPGAQCSGLAWPDYSYTGGFTGRVLHPNSEGSFLNMGRPHYSTFMKARENSASPQVALRKVGWASHVQLCCPQSPQPPPPPPPCMRSPKPKRGAGDPSGSADPSRRCKVLRSPPCPRDLSHGYWMGAQGKPKGPRIKGHLKT